MNKDGVLYILQGGVAGHYPFFEGVLSFHSLAFSKKIFLRLGFGGAGRYDSDTKINHLFAAVSINNGAFEMAHMA